VLRIILVRHGQTAWNAGSDLGEHFRGRIDIGLNPTGLAQARSVADCLAPLDVRAVYASPLQRALDTARPIAQGHGLAVEPYQGLLDIDYGQWGGKAHREVSVQWPELYRRWRCTPHLVQIPGGESLADVRERARTGLECLLARHDGEIIVLVGHQVVNKVLVCALLGLENSATWRIRQDTGCINRFDYDGQAFTVLTLNEVHHLPSHPGDLDELPEQ
jgi:broad specificity phosphatase PhoE